MSVFGRFHRPLFDFVLDRAGGRAGPPLNTPEITSANNDKGICEYTISNRDGALSK